MRVAVLILAAGAFLLPYRFALPVGMLVLLLLVVIYTFFNKDEGSRARWILATVFLVHQALMVVPAYLYLSANNRLPDEYLQMLILRAAVLGITGFVSLVLTFIFALVSVYISSFYMMSLHTVEEGLSMRQIMRSFVAVLLNTNYDWMIISEGEIKTTRPGGVMKKLGGPGKIVIEPGNAVVLQSGGRVTRVCGAGIVSTKRFENIKEIVNLRNQFIVSTVENVITADKIPLTITMGIGYRIKPATTPNTNGVIRSAENAIVVEPIANGIIRDSQGLFPVEEKTILNAVYENTAGKWTGLGGGAPVVQLRDQVMAYTVDELLVQGGGGTPDKRKIKKIEDEILTNLNGFASSKGILFTSVDIQQIKLPDTVVESMMLEIKSEAEARSIRRITEERNRAQRELIDEILSIIANHKGKPLDETDIQLATVFVQLGRRGLADDVLGHQYIEMLNKLAEGQGAKFFSLPNMPFELKDLM